MFRLLMCALILLVSACNKPVFWPPPPTTPGVSANGVVTVEPVATFARPNQTADGSVSYLIQRAAVLPDQVADGQERLQIEVIVSNQGNQALTIDTGSFTLKDSQGTLYQAVEPEARQLPQLLGAEIGPQSTLVGILRFDIPGGTDPSTLTLLWCLQPACQSPLSAPVALPSG